MINCRLAKIWEVASKDLKFKIIAPFSLTLTDGTTITAAFLVKHFGANKGTLVFTEGNDEVYSGCNKLVKEGYGCSVLTEAEEGEQYSDDKNSPIGFIEILREWGWTGPESDKPTWL